MNKVIVRLYVPIIEEKYDIWLPINKRVFNVIILLSKAINELNEGCYQPNKMPILYDKETGKQYDLNLKIKDTKIRNGTELILI